MSGNDDSPDGFTPEDIGAIRLLAIALGLIAGATWLLVEDLHACLVMTGLAAGTMVLGPFAIHLYRRFRRRK